MYVFIFDDLKLHENDNQIGKSALLLMKPNLDVTGPADAAKAIVVVYDIFGYFDQTVQGADILAFSDDHQKYKVFMPDWFKGKPCPIE